MPENHSPDHPVDATSKYGGRGLWLALITLAFIALTVALGQWQLRRAAEKEALSEAAALRGQAPAVALAEILRLPAEERAGRSVRLEGQWVEGYTLLIDNRIQSHRAGYELVSLLRLADTEALVLINRGWIAANPDRSAVRVPPLKPGAVSVVGRLMVPDEHRFSVGAPVYPEPRGTMTLWPSLSIARFHEVTGLSVLPFAIEQTAGDTDGLGRDWPGPPADADRHRAYALQWYCFGLIAAGIYAYRWLVRRRRLAHSMKQDAL